MRLFKLDGDPSEFPTYIDTLRLFNRWGDRHHLQGSNGPGAGKPQLPTLSTGARGAISAHAAREGGQL